MKVIDKGAVGKQGFIYTENFILVDKKRYCYTSQGV